MKLKSLKNEKLCKILALESEVESINTDCIYYILKSSHQQIYFISPWIDSLFTTEQSTPLFQSVQIDHQAAVIFQFTLPFHP